VQGGDTPYLQQQNYSLAALDKRDTSEDPFGKKPPAAAPQQQPAAIPPPPPPSKSIDGEKVLSVMRAALQLQEVHHG
jgi:hypothetical protein